MRHRNRKRWLTILWCAATACLAPLPDSPNAARPKIVPPQASIQVGDTFRFQIWANPSSPSGSTPSKEGGHWRVSDTMIAGIGTGSGLVTGRRPGVTTVFATIQSATASAELDVAPPVLVGAGDIAACASGGAQVTAALLDGISGTVFTAGDNAYEHGTYDEFIRCYDPSWGRHRARTRPAPGNHEYVTPGAAGYFQYFGDAAGDPSRGYYSYDLGNWHIVVVNSSSDVRQGSPQERWLRADLAAHPAPCTVAYWHFPRFSSGFQGNHAEMQPIWQALYDAGADVVVSGHDHDYERFAPQTPSGSPDAARGIREFVVGTGGKSLLAFNSSAASSEVRDNSTFGVLVLKLYNDRYEWEFVPARPGGFTDAGGNRCH